MTYHTDYSARAGEWLTETARRNPEALLVLAAGCALLMRGRGGSRRLERQFQDYNEDSHHEERENRQGGAMRSLRDGVSGAAGSAAEFVGDVKDSVYGKASSYASTVSGYAEEGRQHISRQASHLRSQTQSAAGQVFHEQPLAVAALGLVAGAALAALLPRSEVERRTLRPARDAVADAANRAAATITEAAGEAGKRLQQGAADRGLNADAVKDLARESAEAFTSRVSGSSAETTSTGPGASQSASGNVGGGGRRA